MADNFLSLNGKPISFGGYFFKDDYWQHKVWNLNLLQNEGGSISADVLSGYDGDVVTLGNTPDAGYQFAAYSLTGAELSGNQFAFSGSDVTAEGAFEEAIYTLTLQTDGHGTIAATQTTGHAGDTVTLSNTYNTYYRFNNYTQTGGTLNGSTFTFGNQDATAQANFKVNAFTASGGFEKGSDLNCSAKGYNTTTTNVPAKYAITAYRTSNVPTAWYNTSNRWKVTTAPSAYKITLNTKMTITGRPRNYGGSVSTTAVSLIGSTQTQSQSFNSTGNNNATFNYSKSFTSNSTGVNYGVSAKMVSKAGGDGTNQVYQASKTTGTWTATGYAP